MKYRPRIKSHRPVQKRRRPNAYFRFKRFTVWQDQCGMKVTTDACLFGAVVTEQLKLHPPRRILDIGTGTGILSMMVAQATNCPIDAIEIDRSAWMQADTNFKQTPWADRLQAFHTSMQEFESDNFEDMSNRYDTIICNPPFFKNHPHGQEDARNRALHNVDLPLEDLVTAVQQHITPTGKLYVLLPYNEMRNFSEMMQNIGFYEQLEVPVFTQPGKPVFRAIKAFTPSSNLPKHKENIVIKDHDQVYTWRFNTLLKDYYLKM